MHLGPRENFVMTLYPSDHVSCHGLKGRFRCCKRLSQCVLQSLAFLFSVVLNSLMSCTSEILHNKCTETSDWNNIEVFPFVNISLQVYMALIMKKKAHINITGRDCTIWTKNLTNQRGNHASQRGKMSRLIRRYTFTTYLLVDGFWPHLSFSIRICSYCERAAPRYE